MRNNIISLCLCVCVGCWFFLEGGVVPLSIVVVVVVVSLYRCSPLVKLLSARSSVVLLNVHNKVRP